MAWQIGIDEAGYGPNLGPLVMSMVACRVPEREVDLWQRLSSAVRRHEDENDGRLLVADSKLVYSPAKGLGCLEAAVLALLCGSDRLARKPIAYCLHDLMECLSARALVEIAREPWYLGTTLLPLAAAEDAWRGGVDRWRQASAGADLNWGAVASVVVAPERFNGLIERWGSKGAILGLGLVELLQHCLELPGDDPLDIVVDKQGGRNYYSAILQHAFADGVVLAWEERDARSVYQVIGLNRSVQITVLPRADVSAFCVALASMVSKYLRECLMGEFNRFWQEHIPGLKPTAGYPGDSLRYFEEIQPALAKLGIAKERVWRER